MKCSLCHQEHPYSPDGLCAACYNRILDFDSASGRAATSAERARDASTDQRCELAERRMP